MSQEKYVKETSDSYLNSKINTDIYLIKSILETREDLVTANTNFEFAEGELIDYYLYQIKATQSKYNYLIKKAKKSGLVVNMLDQLEIKNLDEVI